MSKLSHSNERTMEKIELANRIRRGEIIDITTRLKVSEEKELKMLADSYHDLLVAMQAAYIEWQHGEGADEAMTWIANTLAGLGLIPYEEEPYGKEAQAWWDANNAHPMPKCECGRPSNIVCEDVAGCCEEHFKAAKNKASNVKVTGLPQPDGD